MGSSNRKFDNNNVDLSSANTPISPNANSNPNPISPITNTVNYNTPNNYSPNNYNLNGYNRNNNYNRDHFNPMHFNNYNRGSYNQNQNNALNPSRNIVPILNPIIQNPAQVQSTSQPQPQQQPQPVIDYNLPDPSLILPPYLYLGGSFINRNPNYVNFLGITHVLNMAYEQTPNAELANGRNVVYKHLLADDSLSYNIRYHFEEAFQFIDEARNSNGKVLVHCAMGISRSATIVIAYIMSRYRMPLNTAYSIAKTRRKEVNPNPLFMKILEDYEKELYGNTAYQSMVELRPKVKDEYYTTRYDNSSPYRSYSYYGPSTGQNYHYAY